MSIETIAKRIQEALSGGSNLVAVPTALAVDTSRKIHIPDHISLEEWKRIARQTPARAMAFLQFLGKRVMATVVDPRAETMVARVWMRRRELAEFTELFLSPRERDDRRTIASAPEWFGPQEHCGDEHDRHVSDDAPREGLMGGPNEKPPDPPRLQQALALVTVGQQCTGVQDLPPRAISEL